MTEDFKFQSDCRQFVLEQLGVSSDDAAAYYACSECGVRWGGWELFDQESRRWCTVCRSACTPVAVEAIQPKWASDDGALIEKGLLAVKEIEDDKVNELGELVQKMSKKAMSLRGAKRLNRVHVDQAIKFILDNYDTGKAAKELRDERNRYLRKERKENLKRGDDDV